MFRTPPLWPISRASSWIFMLASNPARAGWPELLHRIALPRASASAATRYPRHPRSPGRAGGSRGDIAENTDWRFLNELKRELKA
jgi:hypothetical protein